MIYCCLRLLFYSIQIFCTLVVMNEMQYILKSVFVAIHIFSVTTLHLSKMPQIATFCKHASFSRTLAFNFFVMFRKLL